MYSVPVNERVPVDVARMLQPISGGSPAGESLRYEGTYDEIRAARQEDDTASTRGVWVSTLKRADWPKVEALCLRALESRSKDVQIAAWLVEAWVRLYGFAGMQEGLRLLTALCTEYWADLYPKIEDGDLDYRLAPFIWLNEKLPIETKLVPVSHPDSDDMKAYCWADWELACRGPASDQGSEGSQALFQQSVLLTPNEFYLGLHGEVAGCVEACQELQDVLERECGAESPTFGQILRSTIQIRDYLAGVLGQRHLSPVAAETAVSAGTTGHAKQVAEEQFSGGGPIRTRVEAYQKLAEAAEFLARTEPHSPAPYLVRRAIKWGSMPLTELLPELVRNGSELSEIFRLLQIPER